MARKQFKIVKAETEDFKVGNGTGPFVLESFEPGVRSLHARNTNYWREGANLDALEITAITDPIARVNALIAGDVDLIATVESKSVELIEQTEGVRVNSTPSGLYGGICCLKNTEPGISDDFVKGLQFIQDRERIVRSILKGHGTVGNDHPIGPGPMAPTTVPSSRSGLSIPIRRSSISRNLDTPSAELFVAPVSPGILDSCLLMQGQPQEDRIRPLDPPGTGRRPTGAPSGMKEPLNVVSWNQRPTANAMLAIQFASTSSWNDTFWVNERFDELLKAQLAVTDPAVRHEMLCEMQTLVHSGSGMVIPYPREHSRRCQREGSRHSQGSARGRWAPMNSRNSPGSKSDFRDKFPRWPAPVLPHGPADPDSAGNRCLQQGDFRQCDRPC